MHIRAFMLTLGLAMNPFAVLAEVAPVTASTTKRGRLFTTDVVFASRG